MVESINLDGWFPGFEDVADIDSYLVDDWDTVEVVVINAIGLHVDEGGSGYGTMS